MSDCSKDLVRCYNDEVLDGQRQRIGLPPIPEHPDLDGRGMWSAALGILLTTLRYLAPATLLTLFWGQQSFLFRLFKSIDTAFRAIVFSSEELKEEVIKWLSEAGPVRIERLDTVWSYGWIVCGVLDTALPGACAGHPPTRLTLKHAQAIADHYLGVEPVFSKHELESNDPLSKHQEWKLATYLDRIRQALSKLSPPVSKPVSQRTPLGTPQSTLDYVAKGSGLGAAQVNNKMYFKIYPTSQQSLDPGEITILIRGPKDTYGMTVLPPILGKPQQIRQKILGLNNTKSYTENALPITQGATYLRAYGKNDMNKTFHIPKTNYDIEIEAKVRSDYIRVAYTVILIGKYEISITSRGQNIIGSPFLMTASTNIIDTLERESFCLEDGEEIGIVDIGTDRKVVLRIVDFVTEKMLLRDNGSLEKISDDEAEKLLTTAKVKEQTADIEFRSCSASSTDTDIEEKTNKFNNIVNKVITMNRVCKRFAEITLESRAKAKKESVESSNKQHIPDIVNSTFIDPKSNPFLSVKESTLSPKSIAVIEKQSKAFFGAFNENNLSPKRSAVPINEKSKAFFGDINPPCDTTLQVPAKEMDISTDSLDDYQVFESQMDEELRTASSSPSSNPFLNDIYEEQFDKDLGIFVKTEFETNRSQSEEPEKTPPIQIVVDRPSATPSPLLNNNPFIDPDVISLERPKTPVLKIIKGEVRGRDDSVYVDRQAELLAEELLANEFINPFFIHHRQKIEERIPIADFIIGAPVSLPPMVRSKTPEPDMDSLVVTSHPENTTVEVVEDYYKEDRSLDSLNSLECLTPLPLNANKRDDSNLVTSTFHSMVSSITDNVDGSSLSNTNDNADITDTDDCKTDKNAASRKDMWDSAYVSIDESSPDNNNNENNIHESLDKSRLPLSDDYSNMGPAEKEMWLTCKELKDEIPEIDHSMVILRDTTSQTQPNKVETKPLLFSPILEEIERSVTKETEDKRAEPDNAAAPVTFVELNTNLYMKCLEIKPKTRDTQLITRDITLKPTTVENNETTNKKLERRESVDSASGVSDVKRHTKQPEGKISEVQSNVTESGSVSQTLHQIKMDNQLSSKQVNDEKVKGNKKCLNIVTEKKQYWDERIREIEANTKQEEIKENKRRLSTRNLIHNDSLTRKRAKEVANNFMSTKEKRLTKSKSTVHKIKEVINEEPLKRIQSEDNIDNDSKLVEKWRRYWDTKLDSEKDVNETTCRKSKPPGNKEESIQSQFKHNIVDDLIEEYKDPGDKIKDKFETLPTKQELPEEVFKAFETSPKRFFGTSRKQILNKIDSFLEKESTADSSSTDASGAIPDTGLVSSRISLFHTISNTEAPLRIRRKCQSMHNIAQRKLSKSSSVSSIDDERKETRKYSRNLSLMPQTSPTYETERRNDKAAGNTIMHPEYVEAENVSLKEKSARLVQRYCDKSGDEEPNMKYLNKTRVSKVKNIFKEINRHDTQVLKPQNSLKKSTVSKSEMDIFNKVTNKYDDDLDIHKSYDELPKINVKNFISLYESVSKSDEKERPLRRQKHFESSSSLGAANKIYKHHLNKHTVKPLHKAFQSHKHSRENWKNKSLESVSSSSVEPRSFDSTDLDIVPSEQPEKETTYVSFSDIELEIVENPNKPEIEQSSENETDYKSRFMMAKQFFKSLEDIPPVRKPRKLNECEMLLTKSSTESLETGKPQKPKRVKKNNVKSNSVPSSEISEIWNQLQGENSNRNKLMKISEKFNVDDLFNDVMEGKLSRQGSLRGIPNKKAVLEAFRSMESLVPNKLSPYEMAVSQFNEFAKENSVKNAQTYLSEYPYLPTTDPSKYQSRIDAKAQGLISLKELKMPRRNSVPNMRLNHTFTVNL